MCFMLAACNQAGLGVAAIFGPRNHDIAAHINSMCNTLEIPHIEVRLEPQVNEVQLFSMNLYPDTARLSSAFMDLLKYFKWEKFVVIYGDQSGKSSITMTQVICRTYIYLIPHSSSIFHVCKLDTRFTLHSIVSYKKCDCVIYLTDNGNSFLVVK